MSEELKDLLTTGHLGVWRSVAQSSETVQDRFFGVPCSDLSFSRDDWNAFIAPFVEALAGRYPQHADHIRANSFEDSGPQLEDFDAYGERVDTGLRVRGEAIWRYPANGKHVCMIRPGGHYSFTWVLCDPD